jgi:dolichyl-phosphate beta-glucosyltransferase
MTRPALPSDAARAYDLSLDERTLSIVVPAFNEEDRIAALLARVDRTGDAVAGRAGLRLLELVVVDDGSSDATADAVASFAGLDGRLRTVRLRENRGKGAAVRAGIETAAGELALVTDVDLSAPLEDLVDLAAAVAAGAHVAIGSRALPGSHVLVRQPVARELLGKTFNRILRLLTGLPFRDTQCGFKLYAVAAVRPVFAHQTIDGFAFDAEICLLAHRLGLTVSEVPVRWSNDARTHVTFRREGPRVALDLLRLARLARAPLAPLDGVAAALREETPPGHGHAGAS